MYKWISHLLKTSNIKKIKNKKNYCWWSCEIHSGNYQLQEKVNSVFEFCCKTYPKYYKKTHETTSLLSINGFSAICRKLMGTGTHWCYLNNPFAEKIDIKQLASFEEINAPQFVCKLRKSLYGMLPVSRFWNTCLDQHLKKIELLQQEIKNAIIYFQKQKQVLVSVRSIWHSLRANTISIFPKHIFFVTN